MATLVSRPFFRRLLFSSPYLPTSVEPSCRRCWLSVSSTKSRISQRLLGTSTHTILAGRFLDRHGLPCGAFGAHSPNRNFRQVGSSSNGHRNQAVLAEHGEEQSTEKEVEGLEKWRRGGGVVHKLAQVDASVVVEVGAVIHSHAIIGARTQISSGSVVGSHVTVGSDSKLGFNVALQNCSVGSSCILHSGVCVGQDGFGFTVNDNGEVVKKPQMLKVQIGNNVEIGANACIDRGSWRDTIIGDNTKIDNLVQIGHNVVIGRCCILCGQVGLAGSATYVARAKKLLGLGDYVVMGGKSGVADHISVASKVRIAAKSAVTTNITEPGDYAGFPAVRAKEWRRSVVNSRKLCKRPQEETDSDT